MVKLTEAKDTNSGFQALGGKENGSSYWTGIKFS